MELEAPEKRTKDAISAMERIIDEVEKRTGVRLR